MLNYEKIYQLLSEIRNNNNGLLDQLSTMNIDDQKNYSKKVSDIIEKSAIALTLFNNTKT